MLKLFWLVFQHVLNVEKMYDTVQCIDRGHYVQTEPIRTMRS